MRRVIWCLCRIKVWVVMAMVMVIAHIHSFPTLYFQCHSLLRPSMKSYERHVREMWQGKWWVVVDRIVSGGMNRFKRRKNENKRIKWKEMALMNAVADCRQTTGTVQLDSRLTTHSPQTTPWCDLYSSRTDREHGENTGLPSRRAWDHPPDPIVAQRHRCLEPSMPCSLDSV